MKKYLFIILFLFFAISVWSDELKIPYTCWPIELKAEFKKTGRKLDLHSEDRTKESWGYLVNKGADFSIFTYHAATPEDFRIILRVVNLIEEKMNHG